jgi:hypothetical protein
LTVDGKERSKTMDGIRVLQTIDLVNGPFQVKVTGQDLMDAVNKVLGERNYIELPIIVKNNDYWYFVGGYYDMISQGFKLSVGEDFNTTAIKKDLVYREVGVENYELQLLGKQNTSDTEEIIDNINFIRDLIADALAYNINRFES